MNLSSDNMKLLTDTHTHTIVSGHAYSTFNENVKSASEAGIKLLAVTDHTSAMPGAAHDFYFMNLGILPKNINGVEILTGAEVNIMDYDGNVDASEKLMEAVDLVVASLHPPCINFANKDIITNTILKVMDNRLIQIIGHPGDGRYPLDYEKVVKKAKETGTLLEVNNSSLKARSFRPNMRENLKVMLKWCVKYDNPIVVATDAHYCAEVGQFDEAIEFLEENNFPERLIVNTDPELLKSIISRKRLK